MMTKNLWDCVYLDTQNSDTPPEFTSTKPRKFQNYCVKVRRWLSRVAQLQGPHVLSGLTGPAWDASDELELKDVDTADEVN